MYVDIYFCFYYLFPKQKTEIYLLTSTKNTDIQYIPCAAAAAAARCQHYRGHYRSSVVPVSKFVPVLVPVLAVLVQSVLHPRRDDIVTVFFWIVNTVTPTDTQKQPEQQKQKTQQLFTPTTDNRQPTTTTQQCNNQQQQDCYHHNVDIDVAF